MHRKERWDVGGSPHLDPRHAIVNDGCFINPFKPEFTIVICIHYKPRIAASILDL